LSSGKTCACVHRSLPWLVHCVHIGGEHLPTSGIRAKVHF
jgi:hypothetical protein